jgi:hypothetical protein
VGLGAAAGEQVVVPTQDGVGGTSSLSSDCRARQTVMAHADWIIDWVSASAESVVTFSDKASATSG